MVDVEKEGDKASQPPAGAASGSPEPFAAVSAARPGKAAGDPPAAAAQPAQPEPAASVDEQGDAQDDVKDAPAASGDEETYTFWLILGATIVVLGIIAVVKRLG